MATAFITKYALTAGIREVKGTVEGDRFHPADSQEFYFHSFSLGKEAFLDRADAVKNCAARRDKKVKS